MAWPGHMLEISRNQPSVKPWLADARSERQTLKGSCWSTFDGGMRDFGHRPSASGLDMPLQATTIQSLVERKEGAWQLTISRSVKTLCKLPSTYKRDVKMEDLIGGAAIRAKFSSPSYVIVWTCLKRLVADGARQISPKVFYIRNWRFRIGEEKPLGTIKTQLGFDV